MHKFFIKISLNFIPKGPINNIHTLVQIMTWHRPDNKLLSEPMVVSLLSHIYVTQPQWVNRPPLGTMVAADVSVPSEHQVISNNYVDLTMTSEKDIIKTKQAFLVI